VTTYGDYVATWHHVLRLQLHEWLSTWRPQLQRPFQTHGCLPVCTISTVTSTDELHTSMLDFSWQQISYETFRYYWPIQAPLEIRKYTGLLSAYYWGWTVPINTSINSDSWTHLLYHFGLHNLARYKNGRSREASLPRPRYWQCLWRRDRDVGILVCANNKLKPRCEEDQDHNPSKNRVSPINCLATTNKAHLTATNSRHWN